MNNRKLPAHAMRAYQAAGRRPTLPPRLRRAVAQPAQTAGPSQPEAYRNFSATQLYCPKCSQAMPVREKLLLVLPDGELYDYLCSQCGTSVGSRKT